jgi:hypothetical protein
LRLVQAALLLAAAGLPAPPALTPDQAIEQQQSAVREIVRYPCGRSPSPEEILVCGRTAEQGVPTRRGGRSIPFGRWSAPEEGPWFSWNRGPLSVSCCSVRGGQGTAAGPSISLRF